MFYSLTFTLTFDIYANSIIIYIIVNTKIKEHVFIIFAFSVSTEFLGLMKKVARSPLVMDVLNISNVQRQLERLADLLNKIQKALGEYLERERASFPR